MASDPPSPQTLRLSAVSLSAWLAAAILVFGIGNITITLLRGAKPEWLAAVWLGLFFAWGVLCLWSLPAAYLLLLFSLPFFGARPGDLVTNAQDTIILVTAAVSLWRFPIRLGRLPPLWPGWLLAVVALASLLANASTCFYRLWPFHQDNLTRNVFFMFSQDWHWTIGISEWWMLLMMLILARGAWHLFRQGRLTTDRLAAAVTAGLILALIVGYLGYFSPVFNARLNAVQLRLYDTIDKVEPHWDMPAWLRSPVAANVTMKSFFLNRSWFGLYLLAAAPLAVCFFATRRPPVLRWVMVPMFLACLLAAALTGAKACLYASGLALLLLVLVVATRAAKFRESLVGPWPVRLALLLLACTLLVPWSFAAAPPGTRWLDTTDRHVAWAKALALLKERPLLGVGYESFGLAARQIPPEVELPFIATHNFFLQILTCTGPLGFLALLLLFRIPIRTLLRWVAHRGGPPGPSLLRTGLAFMFVMVVLGGQAQHWFYNHSNALLWWLGLAVLEAADLGRPAVAPVGPHVAATTTGA